MDSKLIELSNLLYTIQDMQQKTEQQLDDMKQDYFCYEELKEQLYLYNRAKNNCGIAYDYIVNIDYAIEEAQKLVETIIDESAQSQKGGDKITSIKPNLQDKAANKVAGMVDIVARVIADDSKRVLSFKTNEVIFGGGRLTTTTNEIDLDYDEFLGVYDEANKAAVAKMKGESTPDSSKSDKAKTDRKGRGIQRKKCCRCLNGQSKGSRF